MNEIKYPAVRTYYILFEDDRAKVMSYGWVDPDQVLDTIWLIDEYVDEAQWIAALLVWGIVPDINEEGKLVL